MDRIHRWPAILGIALAFGVVPPASGQPPRPPDRGGVPGEVGRLAQEMADSVLNLAEVTLRDLGGTREGVDLLEDLRELGQSVGEFRDVARGGGGLYEARRAFVGIDQTWGYLGEQLRRRRLTPGIDRAVRRVDEVDGRIRGVIGLRGYAPDYYEGPPIAEDERRAARREVRALHERAESLVDAMRTQLGDHPNRDHVVQDARQLYERIEIFEEVIARGPAPEEIRAAYAPIQEVATCLHGDLNRQPGPGPIMEVWNSFVQAQYLVHEGLGMPPPPPDAAVILMPQGGGPSPLVAMADQLVGQTEGFINAFAPTAGAVPEGERFLADAERLRRAAIGFREECRRGVDANRLAYRFREVDLCWNRLARRINRISGGRSGPNIQRAMEIGDVCSRIHQVLGMPGYPPELRGVALPVGGR